MCVLNSKIQCQKKLNELDLKIEVPVVANSLSQIAQRTAQQVLGETRPSFDQSLPSE